MLVFLSARSRHFRACISGRKESQHAEEARLELKLRIEQLGSGATTPTVVPVRFAIFATSLFREKVEKRVICSSATEEKWFYSLRHIFGLKVDAGTKDEGTKGLGHILVDKLTRRDIERWRARGSLA